MLAAFDSSHLLAILSTDFQHPYIIIFDPYLRQPSLFINLLIAYQALMPCAFSCLLQQPFASRHGFARFTGLQVVTETFSTGALVIFL